MFLGVWPLFNDGNSPRSATCSPPRPLNSSAIFMFLFPFLDRAIYPQSTSPGFLFQEVVHEDRGMCEHKGRCIEHF